MIPDKSLKRGEFDYRVSADGICFFKWCDNRIVYALSNFHGTNVGKVQRLQKDGSKETFSCPEFIPDYNQYMRVVDQADRLRQAYCVDRRSKKWWHRLFFGLLDMAFVNSYIIYNKINPEEQITLLEYRRNVSLGLMSSGVKYTPADPARRGALSS